jgi:hypothetical protein
MDTIYLVETGFEWEPSRIRGSFFSMASAEAFVAGYIARAKAGEFVEDYAEIYSLSLTKEGAVPEMVLSVNLRDFQPKPEIIEYRIHGIEYDFDKTDGITGPEDYPNLPKEMVYEFIVGTDSEDNLESLLSDYISDTTGFCHNGFKYERLDPQPEVG